MGVVVHAPVADGDLVCCKTLVKIPHGPTQGVGPLGIFTNVLQDRETMYARDDGGQAAHG